MTPLVPIHVLILHPIHRTHVTNLCGKVFVELVSEQKNARRQMRNLNGLSVEPRLRLRVGKRIYSRALLVGHDARRKCRKTGHSWWRQCPFTYARMYSRTVDQLIDGLKGRFFATPFEIAILPALAQTFHPDDRVHTVTQYETWRIYRSAHSYCLPTSHLHHQETLVIEGLDTTKVDKLLPPLLVIEYDLRIMRRNLCDLIDLGGTVR